MDVAQGLQQFRALYRDFHRQIQKQAKRDDKVGPARDFRQARPGSGAGLFHVFSQGLAGPLSLFAEFFARLLLRCSSATSLAECLVQSWSWRLSDSISSANAVSLPARFSILRTAWSTVVWSRP